ncbi:unnamed protein product [Cercopithifilaria johnstoni]|uniref:Uncharacterized protein n=1 Tax=Cercopithifilaria johnstoni TaxID=2874296 RepID=A0A8J2Q7K9_9BILA|nr:unnamed protein product [Cercopithifilaria johnstoni]
MFFIWLPIFLSLLLQQAISQVALILEDWSEWNECSDSCGGCGMQNRTLILLNGTYIVHARHCNTKPCVNEEPCCKPFKFIKGKCLISEKIQNDESKFNDSQNQIEEAVLAWNSIKEDHKQSDDPQELKKEAVYAWNNIKQLQSPDNKNISNVNPNETSKISSDLNGTRDGDDVVEGSGEIDNEMDSKTNKTEILNLYIKNTDASSVPKKKKISSGKGYNRKDYKQRQRRYRQHLTRVVPKPQNAEKSEKSAKMFDSIYEYDYYDYYYYY